MNSDIQVIKPSGILNVVAGNQVRRDVTDFLNSGKNVILVDLQNVEFVDSSGLGALVASMQATKSAGGKLFLCSVNEQVKMLFELTKLERIFQIYMNKDEFESQFTASN